jgi:AcrR family transcriptional regulator
MSAEPVRRAPLSRNRVLRAAVDLADAQGLGALTMRRLGQQLGVEAMSLYKHVTNKDDVLDGIAELVIGEIELPAPGDDWREAMRRRALSARTVLGRHPWATTLLQSRTVPSDVVLGYYDSVIANLRAGGFSVRMAAHAFAVVDSHIFGFALQQAGLPFDSAAELTEVTESIMAQFPAERFPALAEMGAELMTRPDYDWADEFEFGLDLILDGLARARDAEAR